MKIAWASSRVLRSELCSTTQINLANGLANRGHEVRFYSPGKSDSDSFHHVPIKQSKFRGFQASSVSTHLMSRIEELNKADVVLVDWTLSKLVSRMKKPVILMDRSPPANRGVLASLQWRFWKKSWRSAVKGTVVSQKHLDFVIDKISKDDSSIKILPAGVDLDLFRPLEKAGPIKLVYHGRVDVHRGVMSLPMILAGLHSQGVEATLHIHGTGDALARLKNIDMEGLEVTEAIPQEELASKLGAYDVGLLPMPEDKVWNLASPLKRSEYLACGMIVCGIDHSGHQIESSGDWLKLYSQKDFIKNTVSWVKSLDRESLHSLQKDSRKYAENNLSWSHSVDALESIILS